jgi:hypothetical protein
MTIGPEPITKTFRESTLSFLAKAVVSPSGMSSRAACEAAVMDGTRTIEVLLERSDNSGSGTFFEVPAEVMAALGARKRLPLSVRINGAAYRTTTAVYGGRFYVPVRAEIRTAARVEPGQRVTVELRRDDEPRTVALPADLAAALEAAGLSAAFERFSPTHRKEYVQAVEGAKRPETRAARIAKTLEATAAKRGDAARTTAKKPAGRVQAKPAARARTK